LTGVSAMACADPLEAAAKLAGNGEARPNVRHRDT